MNILPFEHSRRMQATLQNGDAGKELDNLRLLESMGLEVRPKHVARPPVRAQVTSLSVPPCSCVVPVGLKAHP